MKIFYKTLIIIILLSKSFLSYSGDIVINEFMSSNTTSLKDEDGDYSDWIELYNKSDKPINLKDYSISDNIKEARKWLFPEITIAPRGFLIIFASDKDRKNGSFLHCNFKLSSAGEALVLTDASNNISDQINPVKLSSDISYGKMPDGGTDMMEFFYPTPGVSNNNSSSSNISFSHNSGYYDKSFVFIITSKDTVYYTLNGSEPNKSSLLYYKPILIDNISSKPNSLSTIQTGYNEYIAPEQLVFKATVIRARAYKNGQPSSSIFTKTFLIDNNIKNLFANQIISLVTDSLNFFGSDTGIYVPGKLFNPNSPKGSGNYLMTGPEWERPLHIEFFDKDGVSILSQNAGTRIHGASVRKFHQKSLRLYAREEYGNKYFNYKLFPQGEENQYKRLIVRSAMCDWSKTIFKDMMGQNLVKDLNIDIQNSYPVNVLINGEYWGLHILAERIDKYYLSSRYRIDPDSLDLLENGSANIVEGTNKDYLGMITYLKNNDISKTSNYNHIKSLMDIDNYIDYQITEIYLNNYDWPENNVKFWKTHKTGSKWRWILYDLDYAFGQYGVDYNMIEHSTKEGVTGWPNSDESTFLFRTLLKNEDFKNQFIGRFDVLMNSVFSASNIVSLINKYKTMIEPDVPAQINRWHYPASLSQWNNNVQTKLIDFANNRASYVRQHLSNKFNLNGTITLTINTNNSNLGKIIINKAECNLTSNKYSGIYFKNIPIVIKAEPAEGCSFTGWTGITGPDSLLIYTDKNLELTANFAKNSPIKNLYINEIMADNKSSNKDEFGEYDDWVEIYNNSNDTINIAGLYFTDNFKNKAKCRIASTDKQKTKITPKSFLVLWADEQPEQGILHINTKLAAEGELAGLFQVIEKDTILIDTIYFGTQYKNLSYGRYPDGGSKKTILSSPTPGESNIYNSISNEQGDINLDFYPNPAKNKLIINITTGSDNKALFNIFSCNGKIVKQLEIKSQGNINKRIEIKLVDNNNTQLPGGIYYINYIDNNINITKKLVIIK